MYRRPVRKRRKKGPARTGAPLRRGIESGKLALGMACTGTKLLFKGGVCLGFVAGVSLLFLGFYQMVITSSYFRLEQVDVRGVDKEMGRELIRRAGLNSDSTLMQLTLRDLKRKMEEHPWVRSVDLERRFPDTLVIRAEREKPAAIVLEDSLYYMNREGELFKTVDGSDNANYPVITGVRPGRGEEKARLGEVAAVLRELESEEGRWSLKELSEIHVGTEGRLSLYFRHMKAQIALTSEGAKMQLEGLEAVTEHLVATDRLREVKGIDLTYPDGAVVSFRKG